MTDIVETPAAPAPKRGKIVPPEEFCAKLKQKRGRTVEPSPKHAYAVRMAGAGSAGIALTPEGLQALKVRYEVALRELRNVVAELHETRGTQAVHSRRKLALARFDEAFRKDIADTKSEIQGD